MAKRAPKQEEDGGEFFDITTHVLVPKHEVCTAAEKTRVMERYGITEQQVPRILKTDVAIASLGAKPGDLIKITRSSPTAGETIFFRIVTQE